MKRIFLAVIVTSVFGVLSFAVDMFPNFLYPVVSDADKSSVTRISIAGTAITDYNLDGYPDMLVLQQRDSVPYSMKTFLYVYINNKQNGFAERINLGEFDWRGLTTAEFDGDSSPELLVYQQNSLKAMKVNRDIGVKLIGDVFDLGRMYLWSLMDADNDGITEALIAYGDYEPDIVAAKWNKEQKKFEIVNRFPKPEDCYSLKVRWFKPSLDETSLFLVFCRTEDNELIPNPLKPGAIAQKTAVPVPDSPFVQQNDFAKQTGLIYAGYHYLAWNERRIVGDFGMVSMTDWNQDGIDDAVVCSGNSYNLWLQVLLGQPQSGFAAGCISMPTSPEPVSHDWNKPAWKVTGDLNKDGYDDTVEMIPAFMSSDPGPVDTVIRVIYGNNQGQKEFKGAYKENLFLHDFNQDGWLDLMRLNTYGGTQVLIHYGSQNGFITEPAYINICPEGGQNVFFGDFNGDGILDIGSKNGSMDVIDFPRIFITLGRPDGTFEIPLSFALLIESNEKMDASYNVTQIITTDFNHDGLDDLWFQLGNYGSKNEGLLWINQGKKSGYPVFNLFK